MRVIITVAFVVFMHSTLFHWMIIRPTCTYNTCIPKRTVEQEAINGKG